MGSPVRPIGMRRALAALGLAALAAASFGQAAPPAFEPARLGWTSAEYHARKLFVSADMTVSWRLVDALAEGTLWNPPEAAAIGAGKRTLELEIATRGPGRRSYQTRLLIDADTGAALQHTSLRGEPSPRYRVYRFMDEGLLRWTTRPRAGEARHPPETWSDSEVRNREYPGGPIELAVTEVSALLYLVPAGPARRPGEHFSLPGFSTSGDRLFEVTARTGQPVRVTVDYETVREGHAVRERGTRAARLVSIEGRHWGDGNGEPLDVLGMHDLELVVDDTLGLVVELRGRAPVVGRFAFSLDKLIPAVDLDHQ
jgi:hypothetical protein